ncbi:MAG: NAD-dependent epimerase/dehydratase family protein [Bacteroidota bacterium]
MNNLDSLTSLRERKRYVISGGAGFIGSHLAKTLLENGQEVIVIDNLSTGQKRNLAPFDQHPKFTFLCEDVNNEYLLQETVHTKDIVVHLAAAVGVDNVASRPIYTANNNHHTTEKILNICLEKQCQLFFASTSEVYGNHTNIASSEHDSLVLEVHHGGRSAYTLSKLYSELSCLSYFQEYKLPVIIGRFFNTIGTGQISKYGMVVPKFVEQSLRGAPITVYGNGKQIRAFCAVEDTVAAILSLLSCPKASGQVFNIGNPEEISILDLAKFIKASTHSVSSIQLSPMPPSRSQGKDIFFRKPSIEKIYHYTGWRPTIKWQSAIHHIIHEYQQKQLLAA